MNKSTPCWILSNFYFLLVLAFQKIKTSLITTTPVLKIFPSLCLQMEPWASKGLYLFLQHLRGQISQLSAVTDSDILTWGEDRMPTANLLFLRYPCSTEVGMGAGPLGRTQTASRCCARARLGVQLLPPGSFSAQTAVLEDAAQAWPRA